MGVKNLWRLLLPVGHRLSIETLSHQTLAIDASIWLTQISKACRDPETGRLLPNRPHVRIFLTRLMRLLYHQIRPVVVFDGTMPEVKRIEIQRRKDRREKLWRDDEDGSGGGALKRAAKKILVKQLKEFREKEASAKRKDKEGEGNQVGVKKKNQTESDAVGRSSKRVAMAAGFTLEDDDDDDEEGEATASPLKAPTKRDPAMEAEKSIGENNDVISINSENSKEEATQQLPPGLGGEGDESENDWEMSHAVQSSIDDSIKQNKKKQPSSHKAGYHESNNPFDHKHYQGACNKTLASLPVEARFKWMESQRAGQRIQSRRECIQAAADPADYSSTQLRNFLKVSKLNKRVGEIDKLVESRASIGEEEVVRDTHSDFQRLKRHNNGHLNSDEGENDFFASTDGLETGKESMKVLFGEDDSDDEDEGDGGFLVSSPAEPATKAANSSRNKSKESEVALLDSDGDNNYDIQSNDSVVSANQSAVSENAKFQCCSLLPSKDANDTTDFRPSSLFELSADKEWEEWGVVDDDETNPLDSQMSNNEAQADEDGNIGASELHASESESDDSDGQEDSFLTLGFRPTPNRVIQSNQCSTEMNSGSKKAAAAPISAGPALENYFPDFGEGDDDGIDWEDGDSGEDHVDGDADDSAMSGVQKPTLDDHNDISHNGVCGMKVGAQETRIDDRKDVHPDSDNAAVAERKESAFSAESIKTDASSDLKNESGAHPTDRIKQFAKTTSCRFDDIHDVIESPSGENFSSSTIVDEIVELTNPPKSNSTAGNSEQELPATECSDESPGEDNEFDSFRPDDRAAAALQHAQETASRLTSWAGRAFQRAISAHVGHQKQDVSPSKTEEIDLNAIDDVIDVDASSDNGAEDSTKVKGPDQSKRGDNRNDLSPEQHYSPRKLELFETTLEGLNDAHDAILEEEKAMERDMSTITDEMKEDIVSLLRLCGIPWVESPSEAEAQCAALEELGLVDGVVTEDSDIFVFGGRKVYKNFFDEKKYVEAYFARDIKRDLALKKHQLVALAMLLGGDYTDGVKGVGIVNGMEALRAFPIGDSADGISKGLTKFREWLDGFGDPPVDDKDKCYMSKEALFHKKHKTARTRWVAPADFPSQAIINAYVKPVVDKSEVKFSWAKPDLGGLQQFCADTLGWEQAETNRVVNPVLKVIESGSKQTRLESYFMRYEDGITFAKVRSKRLKAVLEDIQGGVNARHADCVDADSVEAEKCDTDEGANPKKKRRREK